MSEQVTINCLEFARKSLVIHGTIALRDMQRLREVLFSPDGDLQYSLRGKVNEQSDLEIGLHVSGSLNLVCQRCLGSMNRAVESFTRFIVVEDESRLPEPEEESDSCEYLAADTNLDVLALIEDEVLLSIPMSPTHEDVQCHGIDSAAQEKKESPFKILQGLKLNKS